MKLISNDLLNSIEQAFNNLPIAENVTKKGESTRDIIQRLRQEVHAEANRPTPINISTVEELFDIDKESNDELVIKVNDLKTLLNDIDTAFEVIRISWDNPTPQATSAINDAWKPLRNILNQLRS